MNPKKIIDAKADKVGKIEQVRFEGNQNFTNLKKAIEMTEAGKIENAHSVTRPDGSKYLRSNPDGKKFNNLDEMAKE